jgi:hypothetical protein
MIADRVLMPEPLVFWRGRENNVTFSFLLQGKAKYILKVLPAE